MANTYELEIQAQPSIYKPQPRTMQMFFAEPENGVHADTGLLLIIAGYGESSTSHVYQKMREQFADEYNVLTVQCDYFGYEYMQNDIPAEVSPEMLQNTLSAAELELLQKDYEKYEHILRGKIFQQYVDLDERPEYFHDMGFMQAMDNLRAVKVVMDIAKQNGYQINPCRIYAYGFSHGAYLAYLCNAFWPGVFTAMVDNSSYLLPVYLKESRGLYQIQEGIQFEQNIHYQALTFVQDEQLLFLPFLYGQFENQAQIICYAGETDDMTPLEEKKAFLNQVNHTRVETITKSRIDMNCFKSTNHGLGADFIMLFRHAYGFHIAPLEQEQKRQPKKHEILCEDVSYQSELFQYSVKWEEGMPILYRYQNSEKQ